MSEKKTGYVSWLSQNGIDNEGSFSEGIANAENSYRRAVSQYGSENERRYSQGIKGSGYAGYLSDKARQARDDGILRETQKYLSANAESETKFEDEENRLKEAERKALEEEERKEAQRLEKEEKEKQTLYKLAKRGLEKAGIVNYDKAYEYALEVGVDDEEAKKLASTTTKVARELAMDRVVKAIANKRYTKNQAREYALALGLSEEDAEELGEIAFRTNESVNHIATDDYLDYLEKKKNKN